MDGDRFGGLLGDLGGDPPPGHPQSGYPRPGPPPGRYPQPPSYQLAGQPQGGYPQHGGAGELFAQTSADDAERAAWRGDPDRAAWHGDPSGGAGYGPGGPGSPGGGPSRRVVLTTLGVTALVAVLAGGLWGLLRPSSDGVTALASGSATGSPTASPTGSATSKPAKTPAATKSATATPTPHDTEYVVDPTAVEGMDFGLLRGIGRSGGTVTLRVDRAQFLVGSAAERYYAKNPDLEPLDYAIVNANSRLRSFPLTDDAVVYSQFALGDGGSVRTQEISTDQLYTKAGELLGQNETVLLWLRHSEEPDGPVYYVAEQFTP